MNIIRRVVNAFRPVKPPPTVNEDELDRTLSRASRARGSFDQEMATFEEQMATLRRRANWLYVNKS